MLDYAGVDWNLRKIIEVAFLARGLHGTSHYWAEIALGYQTDTVLREVRRFLSSLYSYKGLFVSFAYL